MNRLLLTLAALGAAAFIWSSALADPLPVATGEKSSIAGRLTPAGDVDSFGLDLLPGDSVSVKVKTTGPELGLLASIELLDPDGVDTNALVKKQASPKPSLKFKAETAGTHTVSISGDPGGFAGATGNYTLKTKIKRAKVRPTKLDAPPGGAFTIPFGVTDGALVDVKLTVKKGGADLDGLYRPDGTPEPGFDAALKTKGRSRYQLKKLPVTGGFGTYELRGTYDAGSRVKAKTKVRHAGGTLKAALADTEPRFDPFLPPFPDEGVPGVTLITVVGQNLSNRIEGETVTFPEIRLGGSVIDPEEIENPLDQVYRFTAPAGLPIGESFDIAIRNPDGQGAIFEDAFTHAELPTISGLSEDEAGPAGGLEFRIEGSGFRSGSIVLIDGTVVEPRFVFPTRIDVVAPPHDPGEASVVIRDEFGRETSSPTPLTYLDVGSNRIDDVSPSRLQGLGGETVTVTGADLSDDSTLFFDGVPIDATLDSSTQMTFVCPPHSGGTVTVRVTDSLQQASAFDVQVASFDDVTTGSIPAPNTGQGVADGWRATRILRGDVDGDGEDDVVLLRPAIAFGDSVDRSRTRILVADGSGGFTDGTSGVPDVSATDDWRAIDGALADVDGQNGPDLLLLTPDELSGGDRSSLRLLLNDGSGSFTDVTATAMPDETTWGDHNQGLGLAVVDVDGQNGLDIVIVHEDAFSETIDLTPPIEDPEDPPEPVLITNHYPATRVLLNDGSGVFTRDLAAIPSIDGDSVERFEGSAIGAADIDGANGPDVVIGADDVREDPDSPGTYLRRAVLLANDGSGTFSDDSASRLPATSSPDFLHGDSYSFVDFDGNTTLDLVVTSNTPLVDPASGLATTDPALRIYSNDGSGNFSRLSAGTLQRISDDDVLQSESVALGDLTGDGRAEIVLVSTRAPTASGHAARVLVWAGSGFVNGTGGLPHPVVVDDGRGAAVLLHDVDGDGDLDVMISRDESDETARNTRVLDNPRIE